jgi:hypothetical protein
MRIQELIVGLNSLEWDIESFKKMKDKDINYYAEILGEVQERNGGFRKYILDALLSTKGEIVIVVDAILKNKGKTIMSEQLKNTDPVFQIHILEIEIATLYSQLESANKIIKIQERQLSKINNFIEKLTKKGGL